MPLDGTAGVDEYLFLAEGKGAWTGAVTRGGARPGVTSRPAGVSPTVTTAASPNSAAAPTPGAPPQADTGSDAVAAMLAEELAEQEQGQKRAESMFSPLAIGIGVLVVAAAGVGLGWAFKGK